MKHSSSQNTPNETQFIPKYTQYSECPTLAQNTCLYSSLLLMPRGARTIDIPNYHVVYPEIPFLPLRLYLWMIGGLAESLTTRDGVYTIELNTLWLLSIWFHKVESGHSEFEIYTPLGPFVSVVFFGPICICCVFCFLF